MYVYVLGIPTNLFCLVILRFFVDPETGRDDHETSVLARGPKPYKSIGSGDSHGPKPYKFIGFGDSQGRLVVVAAAL